jgi:hypothetical protein
MGTTGTTLGSGNHFAMRRSTRRLAVPYTFTTFAPAGFSRFGRTEMIHGLRRMTAPTLTTSLPSRKEERQSECRGRPCHGLATLPTKQRDRGFPAVPWWRRRESNPGPKITRPTASTCVFSRLHRPDLR